MAGVALALTAALAWAVGAVVIRLAMEHLKPTTGTVISLFSGLTLSMSLAIALHSSAIAGISVGLVLAFALYGAINFPLGRFFNFSSIRLLGVSRATPIFSAAPLISMALAVLLLGEQLTVPIALGGLAVVVGVILIVSDQ
jgi:transporter family protein